MDINGIKSLQRQNMLLSQQVQSLRQVAQAQRKMNDLWQNEARDLTEAEQLGASIAQRELENMEKRLQSATDELSAIKEKLADTTARLTSRLTSSLNRRDIARIWMRNLATTLRETVGGGAYAAEIERGLIDLNTPFSNSVIDESRNVAPALLAALERMANEYLERDGYLWPDEAGAGDEALALLLGLGRIKAVDAAGTSGDAYEWADRPAIDRPADTSTPF